MNTNTNAQPRIVSRDQWLFERKKHLAHEKELTKQLDQLRAERRRLPMVEAEKDYVFEGLSGKVRLFNPIRIKVGGKVKSYTNIIPFL